MFLTYNGNLLYHGCIPLHEDGTFMEMKLRGEKYAGRALLEQFEILTREHMSAQLEQKKRNMRVISFGICGLVPFLRYSEKVK